MTNKEAIEFLKNISSEEAGRCIGKEGTFFAELMQYHVEALHLAIKALKKIDKIYPLLDPDIDQEIALDKIREVTYE